MKGRLIHALASKALSRAPDKVIGGEARPYMLRWFLLPRNALFNAYVHLFLRSDDDRALHDHPWVNCSLLLFGSYIEHTIAAGGIEHRKRYVAGDWRFRRSGKIAHRIELDAGPCATLFMTGPRYREWGFHCAREGWIHWRRFADPNDSGSVGKGCQG